MTDPKQAKQCAEMLQAIAEPNRIRIIECLRTGSKNVTELAKLLNVEIVVEHTDPRRRAVTSAFRTEPRDLQTWVSGYQFNRPCELTLGKELLQWQLDRSPQSTSHSRFVGRARLVRRSSGVAREGRQASQ